MPDQFFSILNKNSLYETQRDFKGGAWVISIFMSDNLLKLLFTKKTPLTEEFLGYILLTSKHRTDLVLIALSVS